MPETQATGGPGGAPGDSRDILARIVETKRAEIERLRPRVHEVQARVRDASAARDFRAALSRPGEVSLIAEVKRRSPGAGPIRPGLDPVELARGYAAAGASALSVLTDEPYFGGSLDDLSAVRDAVTIPVLRKDFVLDPAQVWEARAGGADAILLIVRILDDAELRDLRLLAEELGMGVLVEVHDGDELERAVATGAGIIGINNRDLRTFTTRIETTLGLLTSVPGPALLVSESGIGNPDDVRRLGAEGVDAILVGEALLKAPDPEAKAGELAGIRRRPRQAAPESGAARGATGTTAPGEGSPRGDSP